MNHWRLFIPRRITLVAAALALIAIPHLVAYTLGFVWLWQRGGMSFLWYWGAAATVAVVLGWWMMTQVRPAFTDEGLDAAARPPLPFPPVGERAWADVQPIAEQAAAANLSLNRPQQLWDIVWEVLVVVAKHYRPNNPKRAVLEVTVPEVLSVVELVAHDLRRVTCDRVPTSHLLTIADVQRMQELGRWGRLLWWLYRGAAVLVNPGDALLREMRNAATSRSIDAVGDELKRRAVRYAVLRAGYYAIRLYSGELATDVQLLDDYVTRRSRKDSVQTHRHSDLEGPPVGEPLRILVLGQVKSGKSSLVNALFGEPRAATDVLPCTAEIAAYELIRDGMRQAILLDTTGYEDPKAVETARLLEEELIASDLVILVCSATHAARDADRRLLDRVRRTFEGDYRRVMPPVAVAVTHVDELRPIREWQPPYHLDRDDRPKARNIAEVCRTVAEALEVSTAHIVPVCLKETADRPVYNVEEALVPILLKHLPEAKRSRYLRCLKARRSEEQWKVLWSQIVRAGGTLLDAQDSIRELAEKAWKWV